MRQLSSLPDGKSHRTRSVSLEPHVDALVYRHMQTLGLPNLSAALRDLVDRGLAASGALSGPGGDQKSRAYREAMKQVERELVEVARAAFEQYAQRKGVSVPRVKVRG
jgi:50S ribosomal subunit-associated GTPase HflX